MKRKLYLAAQTTLLLALSMALLGLAASAQQAEPPTVGFVINEEGNSIVMFDPASDQVTGMVRIVNASEFPTATVGSALNKPHLAAFDKQSRRLYVGNKGANLAVFDMSNLASPRLVASVKPGGSGEIHRVVLAGGLVWLSHQGDSALYAYDPSDFRAPKVKLGKEQGFNTTHGLTLRPGTDELWSTNRPSDAPGFVLRVDARTRAVIGQPLLTTGKVGDRPNNVEFTDDGKWAYVVNTGSKATEVTVVDAARFEVTQQIVQDATVGVSPHAINFDPKTRRMFVVNMTSGTLSVISTRTNTVLGYFTFVADPHGVTVGPDGQVYAAARAGNGLMVFDAQTLAIIKVIKDPLLGGPHYTLFTTDAPAAQAPTATAVATATIALPSPTNTPLLPAATAAPPTSTTVPPVPTATTEGVATQGPPPTQTEPTVVTIVGVPPTGMPNTGGPTLETLMLALLISFAGVGLGAVLIGVKDQQGR